MFRPVSVELWLSDKNQVKSCFKPHSRCSPPISPCFNKVSCDKEVLWQEIGTQECIVALSVCVFFSSTKALHSNAPTMHLNTPRFQTSMPLSAQMGANAFAV